MRKGKKPPRWLWVPASRAADDEDGEKMLVRKLEPVDVDRGFLELLAQLSPSAAKVSRERFAARLGEIDAGKAEHVYVIQDGDRIVACGTLVVERKFARDCGACGHVEDIVVDERARGRGLGVVIVRALTIASRRWWGATRSSSTARRRTRGSPEGRRPSRKEVQMAKYFGGRRKPRGGTPTQGRRLFVVRCRGRSIVRSHTRNAPSPFDSLNEPLRPFLVGRFTRGFAT